LSRNGASGAEVVWVTDLAPVVQRWVDNFYKERPLRKATGVRRSVNIEDYFVGAVDYIEEQSGVNSRMILRILRYEQKFVTLDNADRILMAIDRDYLLVDGMIPVAPNPMWSQERYVEYMQERGCF
jgi:hypothetical protein